MKRWSCVETYTICQSLLNETTEWQDQRMIQSRYYLKSPTIPQVLNVDRIIYYPGDSSNAISNGKFSVVPGDDSSFIIQSSPTTTWMVKAKTDIIPNVVGHYQYFEKEEDKTSARNVIYHLNDCQGKIYFHRMYIADIPSQSHFVRQFAKFYCFKYEVIQHLSGFLVKDVTNIIVSFFNVELPLDS